MEKSSKEHYHGHRKRLKERFIKAGGDSLADYELLEMVLFLAKPRGDVRPLAKQLMNHYKNFADVIAADTNELTNFAGLGESSIVALKTVAESAIRLTRERIMDQPVLASWRLVLDYCRARLSHKKTEELRVLYLDRKNKLMTDELHQQGTVDHTQIYPREVIKRALDLHASSLILVHNHPSGDPAPSSADIAMTKELVTIAESMGLSIHDHLIIGKAGHTSFKSLGLL
jgi:DNA repair protein RadC